MASTADAGEASTRTTAALSATATTPTGRTGARATPAGPSTLTTSRRSTTATTSAVTTRAAVAGSHMRARKSAPVRCRRPSTMRLVRFEPGRKRDPALAIISTP